MTDIQRFYALRRRVFKTIEKLWAEGECGKSYEGAFEITYEFENCIGEEYTEDKPIEVVIVLHCYLIGWGRHYRWRGRTLKEALDRCEHQVDKWIKETFDD